MDVPEGGLFSTEELSAEKTITGEVSSQGNDTKLELKELAGEVSSQGNDTQLVLNELAGSHANAPPPEWFITIMDEGAESSSTGENQPKMPKIPKIPQMFRDLGSNTDCYDPLVVSIGPYHHGKPELQKMEELKIKMAKQYMKESREKSIQALYLKVEEVAGEAKKYYEFDSSSAIDDQSFTKMIFFDACFVLQYIYSSVLGQQDMGMKIHHTAYVRRDLFLVENQLPYIVLKALMSTRFEDGEGDNMIYKFITLNQGRHSPPASWWNRFVWLREFMYYILSCINGGDQAPEPPTDTKDHQPPHLSEKPVGAAELPTNISSSTIVHQPPHLPEKVVRAAELPTNISSSTKDDQPLHLLDMMRKTLVGPEDKVALGSKSTGTTFYLGAERYQSAKEMKRLRIRFRTNRTGRFTDVRFATMMFLYGKVTLPRLIINDSTKSMLLNMVAFETFPHCPDDYSVTSYICFLDSLINNAEDVAVLRSQNILVNCLSRDEDIADLFNSIAKYLVPNPRAYVHVKNEIRAHYNNIFKKWMAKWLIAFLCSPWFLGSIFALFLSAIQTYGIIVRPKWTQPKQGTAPPPKQ